ncbi:hypothetical protein KQX54_013098 [Cotesia glomerata]|uniref:Uncharacterized protein n=2 Tax=Cotesia glomerata TaxID=32391 RepID=A0AAV7I289_COTGL|nr:hypothetical protein KQX54_013098 [Cotesia glomerata]
MYDRRYTNTSYDRLRRNNLKEEIGPVSRHRTPLVNNISKQRKTADNGAPEVKTQNKRPQQNTEKKDKKTAKKRKINDNKIKEPAVPKSSKSIVDSDNGNNVPPVINESTTPKQAETETTKTQNEESMKEVSNGSNVSTETTTPEHPETETAKTHNQRSLKKINNRGNVPPVPKISTIRKQPATETAKTHNQRSLKKINNRGNVPPVPKISTIRKQPATETSKTQNPELMNEISNGSNVSTETTNPEHPETETGNISNREEQISEDETSDDSIDENKKREEEKSLFKKKKNKNNIYLRMKKLEERIRQLMPNEESKHNGEGSENDKEVRYISKGEERLPQFTKYRSREYYPPSTHAMGYRTRPYQHQNYSYRQPGPRQFNNNQGIWRTTRYQNPNDQQPFQTNPIPRNNNNQQFNNNYRNYQYNRPYGRHEYLPDWRSSNYNNSYPQDSNLRQNYRHF